MAAVLSPLLVSFVAPPPSLVPQHFSAARPAIAIRAPPVVASAKVVPFASTGLGLALCYRAASATGAHAAVLASTGALSIFNLAVTDASRLTSAKRAVGHFKGRSSLPSSALMASNTASQWYNIVRLRLAGQTAGLAWMVAAGSPTGVLCGATAFMAANVGFFLMGAAGAKHDDAGVPAPMKPSLAKFVITTDVVLLCAAAIGAALPFGRFAGSCLFTAGCLIGAVEGAPLWLKSIKGLLIKAE